jgi:hypothetical protein
MNTDLFQIIRTTCSMRQVEVEPVPTEPNPREQSKPNKPNLAAETARPK